MQSTEQELLPEVLSMQGMLHLRKKKYKLAMELLQRALAVTRERNNLEAETDILSNLGSAYGQSGNPEKAAECFLELLERCNERGDEVLRSHTLASLGVVSYDLKKYSVAIDYLHQAQKIYQQYGDDPGRLHVLEHLWKSFSASDQKLDALRLRQEYETLACSLKSGT